MKAARADELHPDVQAFLEVYESIDAPDFSDLSPKVARGLFEDMTDHGDSSIELASVENRSIDGALSEAMR